jgi:hypothetical protein
MAVSFHFFQVFLFQNTKTYVHFDMSVIIQSCFITDTFHEVQNYSF